MKPTSPVKHTRKTNHDVLENIRYTTGTCMLGALLVAQSDIGVCSIVLADDEATAIEELNARFPDACLMPDAERLLPLVNSAIALTDGSAATLDAALDMRGTAFQIRVWEQLRTIPPGQTESYAEIARRIGAPRSARAVARACAANPVALAIPCHRVVRSDGSLSGYRWGVDRKRALLEREGAR